jgi:hypothetical protein
MTHPRSAFGDAPSGFALSPSRGRPQRPGKADSAAASAVPAAFTRMGRREAQWTL